MYTVTYFKKLWKQEIKETWLRSCLINISDWLKKFVFNNKFDETIITLNKKNINPFTNTKSNDFFCKIVL